MSTREARRIACPAGQQARWNRQLLVQPALTARTSRSAPDGADAPDRALIKRAKGGDERAWRWLFRRYKGYVFTVVRRILDDPHQAENVSQEVWLRVWKKLEQFEFRASFKTWITKIAVNQARGELRRAPGPIEWGLPVAHLPAPLVHSCWSIRCGLTMPCESSPRVTVQSSFYSSSACRMTKSQKSSR